MRLSRKQHRRVREAGIALISVLWVLLLVSTLAATTVYISRENALLVRRAADFAQAQSAADAAIVSTLSNLSDEQASRHNPTDGSVQSWQFNGIDVAISVTNEAGRIDVNAGHDDLIYAFLRSQGITEDDSRTLLGDLRQWQRGGDVQTGAGTLPITNVAGLGGPGTKHPLLSTDEFAQIPGWKSQPLGCWSDAFTVYTASASANSVYAEDMDLAALNWADEHHLGDRIWVHSGSASAWTNGSKSLSGEILRIVAQAKLSDTVSARVEWVGRLTGNSNSPALTMRWSHGTKDHSDACPAPLTRTKSGR